MEKALLMESHCSDFILQEFIDKEYEIDCIGTFFNEGGPDDVTRAALFIFFMRTCYNGIYSVNRSAKPMLTLRPGIQPKAMPTSTPKKSPSRFMGTKIIFNALIISTISMTPYSMKTDCGICVCSSMPNSVRWCRGIVTACCLPKSLTVKWERGVCWMIGSVSPAMHKYIWVPAAWVIKHKF